MTYEELLDAISTLRSANTDVADIEAKAARQGLPKSLRPTLSAFSNSAGGGIVILGLDESDGFAAVGVGDAARVSSDLQSMCRADLEPPLSPLIELHEFEGVQLVVAEVPELASSQKPCYVRAAGMNQGSYHRVGDGDFKLTPYEVQMLWASRAQPREDEVPVSSASIGDLDEVAVAGLLSRVRRARSSSFETLSDEDALQRLHAVVRTSEEGLVPTLAGLLSLGRSPQSFFPRLNVTFVHYPSVDGADVVTGERFIDSESFEGAIPVLVRDVLGAIRRNMTRRAVVRSVSRQDVWEYPEVALRESIVNALVHRDLSEQSRGTAVQIEMYPDRLLVRNPGGLFGPVTVEQLGEEGISSARNARLVRLLEDVVVPGEQGTVCENRGSGIKAMLQALRSARMGLPQFRDRLSAFEVNFPNHTLLSEATVEWLNSLRQDDLTESQCVALSVLRDGETLTNLSYRSRLLVDSRVATAELQDLVQRKLVVQVGVRRWATYRLRPGVPQGPRRAQLRPADRREDILRALGDQTLSREEIAERVGLAQRVARTWLKRLREEGKIRMEGGPTQSSNVRYRAIAPYVGAGQQLALPMSEPVLRPPSPTPDQN